jgi:MFS family permease
MGVVWAGAFLGVWAGGAWLTGNQAAIVFGVAVGVFAIAECLHGAIYAPLVVDLAEPQLLGRYMAFSSSTWQIGFFVGPAVGGFVLQHEPLALWPAAAAICVLSAVYALALERRIPERLHLTPRLDSLAGVPGTMANMAPTTDEPLSTDAQPAPHPADEASRIRRGRRRAPGTTRR